MYALGRQAAGPQASQILSLGISLPAAHTHAHTRTHTLTHRAHLVTTQPMAAAIPLVRSNLDYLPLRT